MGEIGHQNQVCLCCAVPYRHRLGKVEFCLVVSPDDRSWEFPKIEVPIGQSRVDLLREHARLQAGVQGAIDADRPLGKFGSSRGDTSVELTAFLMEVNEPEYPESQGVRRRWCLAEEAKARIRRKPMRRLVDTAQRMLDPGAGGI
jgi:hypothetical protein